jgi:hypothetical protein
MASDRDELKLRMEELQTEEVSRRVSRLVLLAFALLAVAVLAIALIVS